LSSSTSWVNVPTARWSAAFSSRSLVLSARSVAFSAASCDSNLATRAISSRMGERREAIHGVDEHIEPAERFVKPAQRTDELLPSLSFDDHGDGLIYGGGYWNTTWYADLWTVRFQGSQVITSFVRNFSSDGMASTPNYAVVADLYHEMYWGIPGYNGAGTAQDVRFLRDGSANVIKIYDAGGDGLLAATLLAGSGTSAGSPPSTDRSPPRQTRNLLGSARPTIVAPPGRPGVTTTAATDAPL